MKAQLALVLFALCMVVGGTAARGQQLYPIQGPAAAQTPPPIYTAKLTGTMSGNITLVLAKGENFTGRWVYVRPSFVNAQTPGAPSSYPPQPNLAFAWDSIFGQGYFLANLVGEPICESTLRGDQGTALQLEFLNERFGVAADSKGNIYKIAWSKF
jgi:hypothetical protein